jgi:hypothetical protein
MPVDRVIFLFGDHQLAAIEVVVECTCGDVFSAETEGQAIRDWQIHVQDEASSHSPAT